MSEFVLRLENVVSPYNGKYYAGFVLDVLREYLGWRVEEYLFNSSNLHDENVAASMNSGNSKIIIRKIEKDCYLVSGFPEEADKEDLQRKAPEILRKILSR